MEKITLHDFSFLLDEVALKMASVEQELCKMDASMGDGDLGLTMKKGFQALPEIFRSLEDQDFGIRIMKSGMKMGSIVPSTMGTLMSSGIMAAGKSLAGTREIGPKEMVDFLKGFESGIANRGKCNRGDRTLRDAIGAAADRAAELLAQSPNATLKDVIAAATEGAKAGAEATKNMVPRFGKAAIHRDAAVGQRDQGACAGMYMLEGMYQYIENH